MPSIDQLNGYLKRGNLGVRIEARGNCLSLVATLPPKPLNGHIKPCQQRIALGVRHNADGLQYAYDKAKLLAGQLATNTFMWENWTNNTTVSFKTAENWINELRQQYLNKGGKLETWINEYHQAFKHIPPGNPLDSSLLESILFNSSKPNTRTRRRYALAFSCLCDFAGIPHNFRGLKGGYSPKAVHPREIPSDDEIEKLWESLADHPSWQWCLGMMACYGLRNHEVFFCNFDHAPQNPNQSIFIERGKSGSRIAYPLYPEWVKRWELFKINTPKVTGQSNSDLGHRITQSFNRLELPKPYTFRHSWARRAEEMGFPTGWAAKAMGHSEYIHRSIYLHWCGSNTWDKIYITVLNNGKTTPRQ